MAPAPDGENHEAPGAVAPADPGRRFAGRVALVTGSGQGIGRATAERLAADGAVVVVNDLDEDRIADTVAAIERAGLRALPGRADVTAEEQVAEVVARVAAEVAPIDILVNNAGGMVAGDRWGPVVEMTRPEWDNFLALNLTSAFLCARAVLPGMMDAGWGRIVHVSSISGEHGQRFGSAYAAAKAGLTGFVASLAKEVAPQGINVNGIVVGNAPHPTRTPDRQELLDGWVHLGRVGAYGEFAAAIAFLCSEDASYLSGALIPVDGGFSRFNHL